jgi:phosphate starvation-inducible PhoH-like protein
VEGIAVCRFTSADVVRHPLVQRIVDAYDERDARIKSRTRAPRAIGTEAEETWQGRDDGESDD